MEYELCETCGIGFHYLDSNSKRVCSYLRCHSHTNKSMNQDLDKRLRKLPDEVSAAKPREHEPSIQEDEGQCDASVDVRRQHTSLVTEYEIENKFKAKFKTLSAEEQNGTDPEAGAQSLALQGLPETHSNEPEAIQVGNQLPLSPTRKRYYLQSESTSEEDLSILECPVVLVSDSGESLMGFDKSPLKRNKKTSTVLPVEVGPNAPEKADETNPNSTLQPVSTEQMGSDISNKRFCVICELQIENITTHLATMHQKGISFLVRPNSIVTAIGPTGASPAEFQQCKLCDGVFYKARCAGRHSPCFPDARITKLKRKFKYYCLMCEIRYERECEFLKHLKYSHGNNRIYITDEIRGIRTLLPKSIGSKDLQFCCDYCQLLQFVNRPRVENCGRIIKYPPADQF